MTNSHHTLAEINSQPEAWQNALEVVQERRADLLRLVEGRYEQVIFTGCGSTYYLSLAGSALFQELTGLPACAYPASELWLSPQASYPPGRTLLAAVSRSGTTTETIKAVERFKAEKRGAALVISNYPDTPLAALADLALIIPKGQEQSVAQTRSFTSMYVAVAAWCALAAGREDLLQSLFALPAAGERLLASYDDLARQTGENLSLDRFYFLGSGARYGLACEASLKMKEMTLSHSEPFHFLEFRHGPMSMVSPQALVIGMLADATRSQELAVLDEMQALGGKVLSLGEAGARVAFESSLPEPVRGVLNLPVLQLMGFYRSVSKGLNPDRPTNLTAVVQLNLDPDEAESHQGLKSASVL